MRRGSELQCGISGKCMLRAYAQVSNCESSMSSGVGLGEAGPERGLAQQVSLGQQLGSEGPAVVCGAHRRALGHPVSSLATLCRLVLPLPNATRLHAPRWQLPHRVPCQSTLQLDTALAQATHHPSLHPPKPVQHGANNDACMCHWPPLHSAAKR